jgi:protein arginine kinase activator
MLCQDCNKREAKVHLKQIVNNQEVSLNLCQECADRRGFTNPLTNVFPLGDLLSSMVGQTDEATSRKLEETSCPVCGLTYQAFAKTGKLGCGACFSTYREPLADLLRKIHGSNLHRGKRHINGEASMEPLKEEARLKDELRHAIESEDFERAAQLRDNLKEVRRKLQSSDV